MKWTIVSLLAVVAACGVTPLAAQQPAGPPAVLRMVQEDIREGKAGAHEKTEAAFMQAAAKENYPAHILGLASITGTSAAVFMEGHNSFASIENSQAALDKPDFAALDAADAALRTGQRSILAVYRPDLSFGVSRINLPKTRFVSIETIQVREGQGQAFTEIAKATIRAAEKSGDTGSVATYRVVSGAPGGTYLLIEPEQSLKAMDEAMRHQQALFQGMGEEGLKQYAKEVAGTIVSQESILYAVSPAMSYVPQAWITADPAYWTPKPVKTAEAPAKPSEKSAGKTTKSAKKATKK